jgi:hypothetical protein
MIRVDCARELLKLCYGDCLLVNAKEYMIIDRSHEHPMPCCSESRICPKGLEFQNHCRFENSLI